MNEIKRRMKMMEDKQHAKEIIKQFDGVIVNLENGIAKTREKAKEALLRNDMNSFRMFGRSMKYYQNMKVSIETIKSPKSLGRDDKEYTVVFDGTAREAAGLYPRNVNVHAALSLAGIGFDRTHSRIISDPSVNTNEHVICVKGEGIDWTIHVTAFAAGAVSGKYVPYSACGSLDRILGSGNVSFV
jgi:hypothetical protein